MPLLLVRCNNKLFCTDMIFFLKLATLANSEIIRISIDKLRRDEMGLMEFTRNCNTK